jgi:hypothetical protein
MAPGFSREGLILEGILLILWRARLLLGTRGSLCHIDKYVVVCLSFGGRKESRLNFNLTLI